MNNKKYISVEDAIKTTWMILDGLGYAFDDNPQLEKTVQAVFDTAPTSDVRPVVKAKWVYTDKSRLVCSNCGNPVAFALKEDGWYHGDYCPNCGADMREES